MIGDDVISRSARVVEALGPAVLRLINDGPAREAAHAAARRGYFTPQENALVRDAFASMLTARAALLELIDELTPHTRRNRLDEAHRLRAFTIGYTAACLLVRAARFLINDFARHSVVQRKLNEGCVSHRMPRKQYTAIYRSLTNPLNAVRLYDARRFAESHRDEIETLRDDPVMQPVLKALDAQREALDVEVSRYARARLRYRWYAMRRRRASGAQQALFALSAAFGRVIADLRLHRDPRVDARIQAALSDLLQPGDVLITRHDHALSNLLLPGFWPHAALHVGPEQTRLDLNVRLDADRAARWVDPVRVLEARKDGVRFRPLRDTLAVDAVTVLRPRLSRDDMAEALSRAVEHEGKLYNFDFDFFTDDRLVCTEVVYRAFEGVGPMHFELQRRTGRPTLSAEDIIDVALAGERMDVLAVFGAPGCERDLLTGESARTLIAKLRLQEAADRALQ